MTQKQLDASQKENADLRERLAETRAAVSEVRKQSADCEAELQKANDGLVQAGTVIDGFQKTEVTTGMFAQLAGTLWSLKNRAREIRRTWPNADFNKRPLYLQSWIPSPESSQVYSWLSVAIEWRNDVSRLTYVQAHPDAHVNMLDFDEVIELLDDAERFAKGQRPLRTAFYSGSPDVQIVRWGLRNTTDNVRWDFGFFLRNHGESASHIVVSPPVPIGGYNLASNMRIQPLLNAHGDTHLRATLTKISDVHSNLIPNTLGEMISQLPANDNGVTLPPILRLVYQDGKGNWYVSKHELLSRTSTDGGNSLLITYRYRELLAMPPWMQSAGTPQHEQTAW